MFKMLLFYSNHVPYYIFNYLITFNKSYYDEKLQIFNLFTGCSLKKSRENNFIHARFKRK